MTRLYEVLEFSFELPLNFVVHDVPFPLNAKKTADDKSDVIFSSKFEEYIRSRIGRLRN